jgi:hypothetical protein
LYKQVIHAGAGAEQPETFFKNPDPQSTAQAKNPLITCCGDPQLLGNPKTGAQLSYLNMDQIKKRMFV